MLNESILVLMNTMPPGIYLNAIQHTLKSIDGITEIHDLHVWNPFAESIPLAVHINVPVQMLSGVDELAENVRKVLMERFRIDHPILQFECNTCKKDRLLCSVKNRPYHDKFLK
jgi:cobalt-zinc-cadmium efflux system protein